MSTLRFPGPLVFSPESPADTDDVTGGMAYSDMVNVLSEIDPAAAIVAAYGARHYLTYEDGEADARLWAHDPALPCCAGTITLIEHRTCFEHMTWLYSDTLWRAVDNERDTRVLYGESEDEIEAAQDDIRDEVHARCIAVGRAIDDAPTRTRQVDAFYRVPFWALEVPEARVQVYERLELTWPEALTFEMYGPPVTDEDLAALESAASSSTLDGPQASHPVRLGHRRGHLALVL